MSRCRVVAVAVHVLSSQHCFLASKRDSRIDEDSLSSINDQSRSSDLISDIQMLQLEYWSIDSRSLACSRRTDEDFLSTRYFATFIRLGDCVNGRCGEGFDFLKDGFPRWREGLADSFDLTISQSTLIEITLLTFTSSTTMALVSRNPNSSLYATLKAVSKSPSAGSGLLDQPSSHEKQRQTYIMSAVSDPSKRMCRTFSVLI